MDNFSKRKKYLLLIVVGILIPPVGIAILCYIVFKYISASKKRIESRVGAFVGTYFPDGAGERTLPRTILIPPEDVKAFHALLRNEGLNVDINKLNAMISSASLAELEQRLTLALRNKCPDLPANPSESQWAAAFVKTLGEDATYAIILDRVAKARKGEMGKLINQEIAKGNQKSHMNRIAQAMKNGRGAQARKYTLDQIDQMDGARFEKFLGELFARMGYSARVTGKAGDQGCDLLVEKGSEKTVVQAKRYSHPLSNDAVQEAVAAKALYGATAAMVVTNATFTESAKELAQANQVTLWDRDYLSQKLIAFF